jgi:hypothetical protein
MVVCSRWGYRSSAAEAYQWLRAALALPKPEFKTNTEQLAEALALNIAGHSAIKATNHAEAIGCFEQALQLCTALDNKSGMAEAGRRPGMRVWPCRLRKPWRLQHAMANQKGAVALDRQHLAHSEDVH